MTVATDAKPRDGDRALRLTHRRGGNSESGKRSCPEPARANAETLAVPWSWPPPGSAEGRPEDRLRLLSAHAEGTGGFATFLRGISHGRRVFALIALK